ncbi:hypothetical protein [Synechococcus sp. MIT S9220]|uniref:hypothetical protein n=1 Tax=Synechococcus sp. MIT S9220 TaxID=166309 RepID=UPI0039B43FFB
MKLRLITTGLLSSGLLLAGCSAASVSSKSERWKVQEVAMMAMTRCLVTGGHFNRNDAAKFIAQANQEQSGQFQRVYDSMATGVSASVNQQVADAISQSGGCRLMLTKFVDSEPQTDFKRRITNDWLLSPIEYPDDK